MFSSIDNSSSLTIPLLPNNINNMKDPTTELIMPISGDKSVISKNLIKENIDLSYTTGRVYANNQPKIFLETITARTATLVIAITYIFFIIGFTIDFYATYNSFHSSNYDLKSSSCINSNITHSDQYGCSSVSTWNGTLTHLENIISVKLNVRNDNVTDIRNKNITLINDVFKIQYTLYLWACYNKKGCGSSFKNDYGYTNDPNIWQKVLATTKESVTLNFEKDFSRNSKKDNSYSVSIELIPSTFQNQESIPSNGLIKSYFLDIEYLIDNYDLFSNQRDDQQNSITYTFDIVNRDAQVAINVITIILLVMTLIILGIYIYILTRQKKVLSEQLWVVAYFFLLILFQNPVYCVIVFFKSPPSINAAYGSYVLGYIAQSGLFILWLLFADSVHRKTSTKSYFYIPKILIGLIIFIFGILILTFQFPGVEVKHDSITSRNAVEAVDDWSDSIKEKFIVITIIYLLLIWIWTIWWFIRLWITGSKLTKLPYMSTRYIQLSYRYFTLQATLVTLYYVFQYVIVIFFISQGVKSSSYNETTITDNINILFRQQTQLFGKILFLTSYAFVLAFLFLPASLMDNTQGLMGALAATYVITENEHSTIIKSRKIMIQSAKKNLLTQVTLMNQIVNAKADVFCVDIALNMRNIAFQAYYDPPNIQTISAYEGCMDLSKIGYQLIDIMYDKNNEVFCFISRHISTGKLVVAFRGTASKRQMEHNLKYTQRPIDFYGLKTEALDQLDGLSFDSNEDDDLDLESISDDDDVENSSPHLSRPKSVKVDYKRTLTENVQVGAEAVGEGIQKVTSVVASTTGAVIGATPGLQNMVKVLVHSGFWEAYEYVRVFIHATLRRELVLCPTHIYFTGHSLGGALATFAALDVSIHTVPRVNAYLKHKLKMEVTGLGLNDIENNSKPTMVQKLHRTLTLVVSNKSKLSNESSRMSLFPRSKSSGVADINGSSREIDVALLSSTKDSKPIFVKKIHVMMYNFGSPRVGNRNFSQLYDKLVPCSYRICVDGDIVPALPPPGKYSHVGTEILIDSVGAGSIIIDPSFVERWLRTHMKSSVAVHSLLVYRRGLLGIKLAAEFFNSHTKEFGNSDPLRVALKVKAHKNVDNVEDENSRISTLKPNRNETHEILKEQNFDSSHDNNDDDAGSDPTSDVDLMSNMEDSAAESPLRSTKSTRNPITLDLERINENDEKSKKFENVQDIGNDNSLHYAHDVENLNLIISQLSNKKSKGSIKWLKRTASKNISDSTKSNDNMNILTTNKNIVPVTELLNHGSVRSHSNTNNKL